MAKRAAVNFERGNQLQNIQPLFGIIYSSLVAYWVIVTAGFVSLESEDTVLRVLGSLEIFLGLMLVLILRNVLDAGVLSSYCSFSLTNRHRITDSSAVSFEKQHLESTFLVWKTYLREWFIVGCSAHVSLLLLLRVAAGYYSDFSDNDSDGSMFSQALADLFRCDHNSGNETGAFGAFPEAKYPLDALLALLLLPGWSLTMFCDPNRSKYLTAAAILIPLVTLPVSAAFGASWYSIIFSVIFYIAHNLVSVRAVCDLAFYNAVMWTEMQSHVTARKNQKESTGSEMRHMVANIAHDIKTPLTSYLNAMSHLTEICAGISAAYPHDTQVTAAAVCLQDMQCTSSFMVMAINRLVDATKALNGVALVPTLTVSSLRYSIGLPVSIVNSTQSRVEVRCADIDPVIKPVQIIEEQWLQENLLCLLSNAVKYSLGPLVTVQVLLLNQDGSSAGSLQSVEFFSEQPHLYSDPHPSTQRYSHSNHGRGVEDIEMQKSSRKVHDPNNHYPHQQTGTAATASNSTSGFLGAVSRQKSSSLSLASTSASKATASTPAATNDNDDDISCLIRVTLPQSRRQQQQQRPMNSNSSSVKLSSLNPADSASGKPAPIGQYICIEVQDSGPGLSDSAMAQLFDHVEQTKRLSGGSGLGLYCLAQRVKALNGYCGSSRRKDGLSGTVIWFCFPYRANETQSMLHQQEEYGRLLLSDAGRVASQITLDGALPYEEVRSDAGTARITPNAQNPIPALVAPSGVSATDFNSIHANAPSDSSYGHPQDPAPTDEIRSPEAASLDIDADATADTTRAGQHSLLNTGHGGSVQQPLQLAVTGGGDGSASTHHSALSSPCSSPRTTSDYSSYPEFQGFRVLLVDDSVSILKICSAMLIRIGCIVDTAENGAEALEKVRTAWKRLHESATVSETTTLDVRRPLQSELQQQQQSEDTVPVPERGSLCCSDDVPYDCILIDLQMPVMDGFEATQAIRKDESCNLIQLEGDRSGAINGHNSREAAAGNKSRTVRSSRQMIIASSASSDSDLREKILAAGADEFLAKPFTFDKFAFAVKRIRSAAVKNQSSDNVAM